MKWWLGAAALLAVAFAFLLYAYFSAEHSDPVTRALDREINAIAAVCERDEQVLSARSRPDSTEPPRPEPVSPCWQSISSVLVDVTPILKKDSEQAATQLAGWGWGPQAWMPLDSLPAKLNESASRTLFDRSLAAPGHEWWDPRLALGCSRYYQVALYAGADGKLIKAYAYQPNVGFTICA